MSVVGSAVLIIIVVLTISTAIVGWGLAALFALRRRRLSQVVDRVQQLLLVAQLASKDPDFCTKFIFAIRAPTTPAHVNLLFDSLYNPFRRNVIEATVFHHLHPEVTAEQALSILCQEIEVYQRKGFGRFLWL